MIREVIVDPDHDRARSLGAAFVGPKYQTYQAGGHAETNSADDRLDVLGSDRFLVGDPEEVAEAVVRLVTRLGVTTLVVHPHWPGLPEATTRTTLELMANEVMPRVGGVLEPVSQARAK